jgi:mercuric ion binding protein
VKRLLITALLPLWLWGETLSLYAVPKMHCPLCTTAVKKSLQNLEGVHKVEVRLNTKQAKIWHDDALTDAALSEAIAATGYEGTLLSREKLGAR